MNNVLKKIITAVLACVCVVSFAAGITGCGKEHTHTLQKVDARAATCTEAGTEAYYICTGCDKLFKDAEGKEEIDEPVIVKALGHEYADEYTCHSRKCIRCDYVQEATTEHVFVDGVCACGEKEQATEPVVKEGMQVYLIAQPSLGDSYLVQVDGYNILIDTNQRTNTGTDSVTDDYVIPFLESKDVDKIDYLLITHPHDDHIGGAVKIASTYTIDNIWMYQIDWSLTQEGDGKGGNSEIYSNEFIAYCEENGLTINEPAENGQSIQVGDNLKIEMWNIDVLENQKLNDNVNALGIIYLFEYKDTRVLFPGDTFSDGDNITSSSPTAISSQPSLDQIGDVDIMLAQHHGGTGCVNTYPALNVLKPEYVFMSFPSPNETTNAWYNLAIPTLTRCNDLKIPVYATGQSGNIEIDISEDGNITLNSSKEGSDMTQMVPPNVSARVESVSGVKDGEGLKISVVYDRPMVGEEVTETQTMTEAAWKFDGIDMSGQSGSYVAWNAGSDKNVLVFFVPASLLTEKESYTFTIDKSFKSFNNNGVWATLEYISNDLQVWENNKIVHVQEVNDYGWNFNQTLKCINVKFDGDVTTYTDSQYTEVSKGLKINGLNIDKLGVEYNAPSGKNSVVLFIPKTLWERATEGVVLTVTTDMEFQNGYKIGQEISYIYDEDYALWVEYTDDEMPPLAPEKIEVSGYTNERDENRLFISLTFTRPLETIPADWTYNNYFGLKINGEDIPISSSLDDANGFYLQYTPADNRILINVRKDYLATFNKVVLTIPEGFGLAADSEYILEEINLLLSDEPYDTNPANKKLIEYTGDFSEITSVEYTSDVTDFGYEVLSGDNAVFNLTMSKDVVFNTAATYDKIDLAGKLTINGVAVTEGQASLSFEGSNPRVVKLSVLKSLLKEESDNVFQFSATECYEATISAFTENFSTVGMDFRKEVNITHVAVEYVAAEGAYYGFKITVDTQPVLSGYQDLTDQNDGLGILVNNKPVRGTVVWGEDNFVQVNGNVIYFYVLKSQVDATNGLVLTIKSDSQLYDSAHYLFNGGSYKVLTGTPDSVYANHDATEIYTGDFSEFEGDEPDTPAAQEVNIVDVSIEYTAAGGVYYGFKIAFDKEPILSGNIDLTDDNDGLGILVNNKPVRGTASWGTSNFAAMSGWVDAVGGYVVTFYMLKSEVDASEGIVLTIKDTTALFDSEEYDFAGGSYKVLSGTPSTYWNNHDATEVYTGDFSEFE